MYYITCLARVTHASNRVLHVTSLSHRLGCFLPVCRTRWGSLSAPPDPLAAMRGPTSKEMFYIRQYLGDSLDNRLFLVCDQWHVGVCKVRQKMTSCREEFLVSYGCFIVVNQEQDRDDRSGYKDSHSKQQDSA